MKHTKLYLIALFIACCMLMVCPFAHAESMDSDIALHLDEIFNSYPRNSSYNNLYSEAKNYCPYYLLGYWTPSGGNYSCLVLMMSSSDDICFAWSSRNGGNFPPDGYDSGFAFSSVASSLSSGNRYYTFIMYPNSVSNSTAAREISQSNNVTSVGGLYRPSSYSNQKPTYGGSMSIYSEFLLTNLERFGRISYSKNASGNYIPILTDNEYSPISYTNDARLKLYKLWSSQNGDSLVVDLSEFRTYTAAAAYNFSNIVLTLTCNGVDTEYSLPLTSSTINNGWDNNSNLYTISTPVSDFTLSETYDTYITKLSFNLDFSSPGGTGSTPFYISTNFPLDVHHSIITPDVIPTPATVYDDPAKPIDISDRQYDLFQQLQSNVAGGDIVYVNNYPVLPSWANVYNLNTFFYDNKPDELNIYYGAQITGTYFIDSKYDFDIKTFLYDNANYAYYDVVIIRIDNTVWPSVVNNNTIPDSQQLYGYVVLYTSTYYMRLDAETQINILEAIQLDAKQSIENWNWLVDKMDDFENKSLEILNPLYDETTYIDDKLASILYAVNNIESYNDSSIVTLLTDIKSLLSSPENEIDTPQECIQLYEAHPDYFNELWGTPIRSNRSSSVTPSPNNPYISSDYVRVDLVPAWWEGKTLTMVYILKNDGDTSRFYDSILGGLFDAYENLIESDSSFTNYIDSLFKTGYDYTDSFYGHLFDLDYDPEEWEGGFGTSE